MAAVQDERNSVHVDSGVFDVMDPTDNLSPRLMPEQSGIGATERGTKVAEVNELVNGQMKTVDFEGDTVLLSRVANNFYATANKCTHYNAPLDKGVLNGERVVCPWHGACFNVRTGEIEEGMVLEPLKTYRVFVAEGNVYIKSGQRRIAIIGGGAGAAAACEQIRKSAFMGIVDVYSEESELPYDRTKISKTLQRGGLLRNKEFYDAQGITVYLNTKVVDFDGTGKYLVLAGGVRRYYDSFLIATGGIPIKLGLGEEEVENFFTIRNSADIDRIRMRLTNATRVVIIGGGVLGLEMASSVKTVGKVKSVVIVDDGKPPNLRGQYGEMVYDNIRRLHEKNGVVFMKGPTVKISFSDMERLALGIETEAGVTVEGDMFLVCIGISPATGFIRNIPIEPDGSLLVNRRGRVLGCSEVYACGDITCTIDPSNPTRKMHIHHWGWAMQQGRVAAQNMCGVASGFNSIPVFWLASFGVNYRFCGYLIAQSSLTHDVGCFTSPFSCLTAIFKKDKANPELLDETRVIGTDEKFVVYYIVHGQIQGVASLMCDPVVTACAELLRRGKMITVEELRQNILPQEKLQKLQNVD